MTARMHTQYSMPLWLSSLVVVISLFVIAVFSPVLADTRQVIDYLYDGAGNIIGIQSDQSDQAPSINSITPSQIRINQPTEIILTGTGLNNPTVSINHPDIDVQVNNSSNANINLTLLASPSVAIASYSLTVTTSLGSDSIFVNVRPELPQILLTPSPIVLPDNNVAQELDLSLSSPDLVDHTLTLTTTDSSVASINIPSVTIPAGQTTTSALITMTGHSIGNTALTIANPQLGQRTSNVFVTSPYTPSPGDKNVYSKALGLVVENGPQPPVLESLEPFYNMLSVIKESEQIVNNTDISVFSANLQLVYGQHFSSVSPQNHIRGQNNIPVSITGQELTDVNNVQIQPNDNITISAVSVSPDGSQVHFNVTVDADATIGQRRIVVSDTNGNFIPPSSVLRDRLYISDDLPEVTAINPIVLTRLQTSLLTIYGENLQNTSAIDISPSAGINLGSFSVNADGTELTIGVVIDELAPLGPRTVTVTTGAGTSNTTRTEKNTLTIVNGPVDIFESISAPGIGVVLSDGQVTSTPISLNSANVNITFGSVFTALSRSSQVIGTAEALTIQGQGLQDITNITFAPSDGITTDNLNVAADGESITIDISVSNDADQTLRQISLSDSNGVRISPAFTQLDRFLITAPQPAILSLTPNTVITDTNQTLIITGKNFSANSQVAITPADGISISTPVVNANGTSISVDMSVSDIASTGQRLVQVSTEAGQTSSTLTPANTLNVADTVIANFNNFVSPPVGIVLSDNTPTPSTEQFISSTPVTVLFEDAPPPPVMQSILTRAAELALHVGDYVDGTSPNFIVIGQSSDIVITGQGLDSVTSIELLPDDGLTIGNFTVASDGRSLTLPISAAIDAQQTIRTLRLNTANGQLQSSNGEDRQLMVTSEAPTINSIDPIQEVIGNTFEMTIRGNNLQDVININAIPADGISFGTNPAINADGTSITVQITIDPLAQAGPRVITVTTLSGETSDVASPANTFTVLIE